MLLTTQTTGIVTFLFTDTVRSSELRQVHPEAIAVALAQHDGLTASAVQVHHGHIVKMRGDGLHAVFVNAVNALWAAHQEILDTYKQRFTAA